MKPVEPWMHAAARELAAAIATAARPDPAVWADQWAEANRVLPEDSPEPGPFRTTRTPYLIDIMRTMSPSSAWREGWWMKPHQVGGSVSGENLVGTWICTAAGNMLVVFATLDDAKQWELTRFEPMRASTRALRRRVRPAAEKGADNTKLRKKYPGGTMRLIGANRVGAMKSATIRYIKFEEPDEYGGADQAQGSLVDIIRARTSNWGRKAKIYGDGTPTVDGRSEIQRQVQRGDQRQWHLHCPDCAQPQVLAFEHLRWEEANPNSALYHCTSCGAGNTEPAWKERNYAPRPPGCTEAQAAALGLGHWLPTARGEPGVASWCGLEALAAPIGWRPWPELVVDWLAAAADDDKRRVFYNNMRGKPYRDTIGTEVGAAALQQRAEQYELMSCPMGGLVLMAGVDTQDNRLAVVMRAFGRGEESWGIWHGEIYGDPSHPDTWAKLRELLQAPVRHASGQTMRVDVAFIDAGGHHGEDVYAFCRDAKLRGQAWHAIRGATAYDAPKLGRPKTIDFTWRGKAVPGGVEVRFLGTQAIKNLLDGRLKLAKPGGGYYHFPLGFQPDYYQQLRAEKREWRRDRRGRKELWWVCPSGARNEAGDCEVYAYAAYLYAMSGRHADAVWAAREKVYGQVRQLELLPDGTSVQAPAPPPPQPTGATAADTQAQAQPALPGLPELDPQAAAPLRPGKGKGSTNKPRRGWVTGWRR